MADNVATSAWLMSAAQHAAENLTSRGINPGDRVCLSAPNSAALLAVALGCLQAGIIPAMVSSSATERELREMSGDIDASAVLTDADVHELIAGSAENIEPRLPTCRPMHFTSGTSGRAKAVWSGWLNPDQARAWIEDETQVWGITQSDVHLVCGPLSHSAPLRFALMTALAGGSVVVPTKFTAEAALDAMTHSGVTSTFMAPTHMQRIMQAANDAPVQHSLRLLAHAGAACPDGIRRWAHDTFGTDVVTEFYGSTEGQFTICPAPEWIAHPGTVGRARPGRQMHADPDGRLWSKAPDYARFEYWGDPEKTKTTWRDGDWFTVGDYGFIDDEGYVFLQGRMGDLIITGGVNVYPAEIERVLSNCDGVEHAIAFGLPDPDWGQRVCVAVVGTVTQDDIAAYLAANLSGPKRPKSIFVVDALPLTHSGKVHRAEVPPLFADHTAS